MMPGSKGLNPHELAHRWIVLYFALSKFWHHRITKPYLINEKKSTIAIHIQSRYNKINQGTNGEKMDASIFISTGSAK